MNTPEEQHIGEVERRIAYFTAEIPAHEDKIEAHKAEIVKLKGEIKDFEKLIISLSEDLKTAKEAIEAKEVTKEEI